jgi:hypothetical protein
VIFGVAGAVGEEEDRGMSRVLRRLQAELLAARSGFRDWVLLAERLWPLLELVGEESIFSALERVGNNREHQDRGNSGRFCASK